MTSLFNMSQLFKTTWPPGKTRRRLIYSLSCILLALLTTLAIVLNGADCLSSTYNGDLSVDRVVIAKSPNDNQSNYKSGKDTFKETYTKLVLQVKENTPIGTKLADIQAENQNSNSKITYAIVDGADETSFTLREVSIDGINTGELISNVPFDFESPKRKYQILVRGTSPFLRYDVEVDIVVMDENDNKPQLDDFYIAFNNYKNNFPGAPIGRVPATDADVNDQLRYRVVSGNNAQLIVVNETNGDIQLSPWLNSNVPIRAPMMVAVSDGVNEVVAQLVLTVNLVTETMLQNSIVLRLDGLNREEFLTKKYELFLSQMARILGTNNFYLANNIVVFDVEESIQEISSQEVLTYIHYHNSSLTINSTLSVNVSFSARTDGGDVEAYMSSRYIEDRINFNREHLSRTLEVYVAPFQDNLCAQTPCQSYQECQAIYKFEKAPKTFIITKNMIFRPIRAVQSFLCSCPQTFTGLDPKSVVCCNCDETKGFDGDCDKTTGQCFCKPNHYQLVGSEYCLPCDCYGVGSLSDTCNQTTGQCRCRPGVVGTKCDTCSSSWAEVTKRGCDVIYDACPKTYSDGIWWDKTEYGKSASQPCPQSTSTGTATRYCDKTEGWQKSNMFDCISNTFTDLYNQYQAFEENKFPLSTTSSMKIASNLRAALNETISNPETRLYGSDIYISFRLIHHLIHYETKQTGLNLTHRQDRLYIRNIAESINYILDPIYAEDWLEISARRSTYGGAEHILRLIDMYGRVLIETRSDTHTQPFEVSTKYFTFGMDTLSTEQVWGIGKTLDGSPSPSSPPYATDPFGPPLTGNTIDTNTSFDSQINYNNDGSSLYLDYSLNSRDSSPAIMIPKYDNYPSSDGAHSSDTSRALIPLKTLRIKTTQDNSNHSARSAARAKRDEIIIPEFKYLQRQPPALVAYSIYRSLGPLLPNSSDTTVQNRFGMVANSPVIWLTLRPANSSDFLHKNVNPKINYMLKMMEPTGKTRPQCAVWEFLPVASKNQTSYGIKPTGRFTTKGCELKGIHSNHRLRFKYDYINCSCDHLGAVTVLMDSANYDYIIGEGTSIKDTALIVALSISLALMTIVYFILSFVRGHSIKSNSNSINKNLIFILIAIELLFLYTILSKSSFNQREYQCKLVAIFLHYFSVSLFFWLLVNAIHFYRMLTELRDINHGPMKFYHVLGYAVPAFFVSIAVGLRIENFGHYLFCWLSIHEPIIWSMFGPISFVSAVTIVLFLLAFCKSLPVKEDSSGVNLLKDHMLINIIKTPLIGIYWLIAVYVFNESLLDNVYLFPSVAVVKSIALFILLCIVDKHIKYNLYVSWLRFKGEKVPFIEESMNYSSNQWMPSMVAGEMMPGALSKHYPYAGYNGPATTPGFQSSCTDIFRPDVLAFSAASTTSRSTATGTSSSAYHYQQHRVKDSGGRDSSYGRSDRGRHGRRKYKKSHHKHHHHRHHHHHHHHRSHRHHTDDYEHYGDSRRRYDSQTNQIASENIDHSQNDLASSHSSDRDDVSTLPKKNFTSNSIERQQHDGDVPETTPTPTNNILSKPQEDRSDPFKSDEQQTVPMELSAPSTSGAQAVSKILGNPAESNQSNA